MEPPWLERCCGRADDGRPRCLLTRCCCCTLRTGVIVIASFELIFCLLVTILFGLAALAIWEEGELGRLSFIGMALQTVIHFVVACVLIHGVRKNNRRLLWAWIWARGVELLTDGSKLLIMSLIYINPVTPGVILLIAGISILNIFVVRSYVLELKARADLSESPVHYNPVREEVHA